MSGVEIRLSSAAPTPTLSPWEREPLNYPSTALAGCDANKKTNKKAKNPPTEEDSPPYFQFISRWVAGPLARQEPENPRRSSAARNYRQLPTSRPGPAIFPP